jgi:hypothetical protein
MISRMLSAFMNDSYVYQELKGEPRYAAEAWFVITIPIVISAIFASFRNGSTVALANGLGIIAGYLIFSILAWLIGTKLAKGAGSFTDVRVAIAYAYSVPILIAIVPVIGIYVGLWFLVTASTAIRETLGLGKGLTFFIVLLAILATVVTQILIGNAVPTWLSQ